MRKTPTGQEATGGRPKWRRVVSLVVLAAGCAFFAWALVPDRSTSALKAKNKNEALPSGLLAEAAAVPQDLHLSKFGHTNPQHARLPCLLCHRREDNSPSVRRPGHTPCAGCHTQQFAERSGPVCAICHTDAQSGALKPFPPLRTFNVSFDHATHVGVGSPSRQSCATCHKPERRGVSLSIPEGTSAHATCFACHTPRAQSPSGRDISSCGTCHRVGGYSRTPETAAAYRVNFSHAAHTAKGLSCAECHGVRPGSPQRRQVSAPVALMHHAPPGAKSCASCHDNKRAFGGDDFDDCTRCHKGPAWHF
jgi:c(7)-type cytochrome triheme protein